MAYRKQGWQDALQALKSERGGSNDPDNQREQKVRSRLMYKKRKLDKDIKRYTKNRDVIKFTDIIAIQDKHGIRVY